MRHRTTTQLHATYYVGRGSTHSSPCVSEIQRGRDMANKKSKTYKVGRDAKTGKFIPVETAKRRKSTAIVETMKKKK